jgi:CheY-like chemotaxis protein/transcriptional regulator with XRE-family HTH domain
LDHRSREEGSVPLKAVALKEEGTHSPAEGVLRRFAKVRTIRTLNDVRKVKEERPDIVLMDLRMPDFNGKGVLQVLSQSRHIPVFICFDSKIQPAALLKYLTSLGNIRVKQRSRTAGLSETIRLLGISQEALGRVLNVSSRTVHRWLKGSHPKRNRELERLLGIVALLERTLPTTNAIHTYLYHPNPSLAGDRPIDALTSGDFDRIESDLQAIQEGVYV